MDIHKIDFKVRMFQVKQKKALGDRQTAGLKELASRQIMLFKVMMNEAIDGSVVQIDLENWIHAILYIDLILPLPIKQ
jgi:hypothetical protein